MRLPCHASRWRCPRAPVARPWLHLHFHARLRRHHRPHHLHRHPLLHPPARPRPPTLAERPSTGLVPAAALHADSTVPFHSFVGPQHAAPYLGKILTGNIFDRTEFLSAPVLGGEGNHTRPTLKIQDGCDSRCSYCVIPFVRGRSRSLPPDNVIAEIGSLSESGYREIVLSGINLGAYGR